MRYKITLIPLKTKSRPESLPIAPMKLKRQSKDNSIRLVLFVVNN